LIALLKQHGVALEANPLSNLLAGFIGALEDLRLDELLRAGVCVSINSDDPALFRRGLADNFKAVFDLYNWGEQELVQFTQNALAAAHLSAPQRAACVRSFSNKCGLALD
jgi:adenosine deaminase